jgi:phospholipase B-like protein
LSILVAEITMAKSVFSKSSAWLQKKSTRTVSSSKQNWLRKAYRFERAGWLYVHIEGGPKQRGFQHGYLMAAEIGEILKLMQFTTVSSTGENFAFFSKAAERLYANLLDAEITAEMEGIAEGASSAGVSTSFADVLAWNANIELLSNWWPTVQGKPPGPPLHPHHHCSSFIATGNGITKDGGIVLAHNTWDSYINSSAFRLILDIAPSEGHQILMHSAPGLIHSGTDFFITGGGLVGSETTIAGFSGYDVKRLPEFYRVRKAMQYAGDVGHWIDIMKTRNNGGYANSWLIGDIKSAEIARLELGLKYAGVERTKRGSFWGCNLVIDPRIRNQECTSVDYSNIMANAGRRVRLEELLVQGRGCIDRNLAKRMIADHYDAALRKHKPGTRSICSHFDEDSSLFAPLGFGPFEPYGANDAKVTDSEMAKDLAFLARFGRPCGQIFDAAAFLRDHPQYGWQAKFLQSKPKQPWTRFASNDMH